MLITSPPPVLLRPCPLPCTIFFFRTNAKQKSPACCEGPEPGARLTQGRRAAGRTGPFPPRPHGDRGGAPRAEGSPRARYASTPLQAGRGVPGAAALSGPRGPASLPPPRSLPRACQLGPNLISVLSVRTPLKPNSADYQQLSWHARPLPPRGARRGEERGPAARDAESLRPRPGFPRPDSAPGTQLPGGVTGPFLRKQWDRRKLGSGGVGHTEVTKSRLPLPAGIPWAGDCRPPASCLGCSQQRELPPTVRKLSWVQVPPPLRCATLHKAPDLSGPQYPPQ